MGVIVFIIIVIIIIAVVINVSNSNKRESLKSEYENALEGTDKTNALEAGRAYYRFLRKDKKLTIYDEQAITNDLNTMESEVMMNNSKQSSVSSVDKLEKLAQLKAQGVLTEEEFNQQKAKILNE